MMRITGVGCVALCLVMGWMATSSARAADSPRPDIVIQDFDGKTWGEWKGTGDAFGPGTGPIHIPRYQGDIGYLGTGYASTFVENYPGQPNRFDKVTGTLTSPPFRIERRYLSFIFGGGVEPRNERPNHQTCVNLIVGGKTHQIAAGGKFIWHNVDVTAYDGQMAQIEIVDSAADARLAADEFRLTDKAVTTQTQRTLVIDGAYLNVPVKHEVPNHLMKLEIDGKLMMSWSVELARTPEDVDFWTYVDVAKYRGKTAVVSIGANEPGNQGMAMLSVSDKLVDQDTLYKEPWRPQFHFSTRRGWLNDPNGLFYYKGEWHLFYQWGPTSNPFNNIFWGHAVSKDLVHWEHLPAAVYPGEISKGSCWSGSGWADNENVCGLGKNGDPPLLVYWTDLGAGIAMAYSTDRGRTWAPYEKNPVFRDSGRDPAVCWVPELKRYIALTMGTKQYESVNLKDWTRTTVEFPGCGECPDLYQLNVDGDPKQKRWVFYSTIGTFVGNKFVADDKQGMNPFAGDFTNRGGLGRYYAQQTFRNGPDGRVVEIGWLRHFPQHTTPDAPDNWMQQCLSVPYDLTLRTAADGVVHLHRYPVPELKNLRGKKLLDLKDVTVAQGENPLKTLRGKFLDMDLEFELPPVSPTAPTFGLKVRGIQIMYQGPGGGVGQDRRYLHKTPEPTMRLRVLVDNRLFEAFLQEGRKHFVETPSLDDDSYEIFTKGGSVKLKSAVAYEMKSMWE